MCRPICAYVCVDMYVCFLHMSVCVWFCQVPAKQGHRQCFVAFKIEFQHATGMCERVSVCGCVYITCDVCPSFVQHVFCLYSRMENGTLSAYEEERHVMLQRPLTHSFGHTLHHQVTRLADLFSLFFVTRRTCFSRGAAAAWTLWLPPSRV